MGHHLMTRFTSPSDEGTSRVSGFFVCQLSSQQTRLLMPMLDLGRIVVDNLHLISKARLNYLSICLGILADHVHM